MKNDKCEPVFFKESKQYFQCFFFFLFCSILNISCSMGNSFKKSRVVRVRPKFTETFFVETMILEEVGHGKARKYRRPKCSDMITSMRILTAFIGNLNSSYRKLSRAGLLLWILSMAVNFMYDGYESRAKYGYPWMCVRGLLWVTCCVCTWFTARRTMPWLEKGLTKLERDKRYRKALRDMASTTTVRIFGVILSFPLPRHQRVELKQEHLVLPYKRKSVDLKGYFLTDCLTD